MAVPTRQRWETSATIAINTDWFSEDISGRANVAVKHTLQIMVPASTIVNLQIVFNSITKVFNLNKGTALNANNAYQFDFIVYPGMTYNIQHVAGGSQNVAVSIIESDNVEV